MQAVPFLIGASLVMGVAGTITQMNAAKDQAYYQQQIINQQKRQNNLRAAAMTVDARRKQMEMLRQAQRARAIALAAATNQGAAQGSGLPGAYGQISGATGVNYSGVNQSLAFGNALFASDAKISDARMGLADASTLSSFGSGLSTLGGQLMGATGTFQKAFGAPAYTPYSGGASYNYGSPTQYGSYY